MKKLSKLEEATLIEQLTHQLHEIDWHQVEHIIKVVKIRLALKAGESIKDSGTEITDVLQCVQP